MRNRIGWLAGALALVMICGCDESTLLGLLPDDQYEPNDRSESAYDMTDEDVSSAVVTYINAIDYFTFQTPVDVSGGVIITCGLAPDEFAMRLLEMDETEIESVDGVDGVAVITTSAVSPSTWYLIQIELMQPEEGDASTYGMQIAYP